MTRRPETAAPSPGDLVRLLAEAEISIPQGSAEKLSRHAAEMLRWNRSVRLTAITDPEEIGVKHILDSLLLLRFLPFDGRTLDFGSGAGYPGIPLAVALPDAQCWLIESSGKKCAFLREIVRILCLGNVHVVNRRLEGRPDPDLGSFEQIVTRATLPPAKAFALLHRHLSPGGRIFLMAGPGAGDGDSSPLPVGRCIHRRLSFVLPRGMGSRRIHEIRVP